MSRDKLILLRATYEVVGQRLDLLLEPCAVAPHHVGHLAPGHGIQPPDGDPATGAAGDLGCAQNRRVLGHVGKLAGIRRQARALRRAADPP
jgi:hypothetical protein